MTAIYHPEFKASFDEAVRHYAAIGTPLADRFKTEVKSSVKKVLTGMVKHAPGPHGFRCYRCKKFPYLVYYEWTGETVQFLGVIYAGRAPELLRESLARYHTER